METTLVLACFYNKTPQTESFIKNRKALLRVQEPIKSKTRVLAPGEGLTLSCYIAGGSRLQKGRDRERKREKGSELHLL